MGQLNEFGSHRAAWCLASPAARTRSQRIGSISRAHQESPGEVLLQSVPEEYKGGSRCGIMLSVHEGHSIKITIFCLKVKDNFRGWFMHIDANKSPVNFHRLSVSEDQVRLMVFMRKC